MMMKFLLLIIMVFASDENNNDFESDNKSDAQNEARQSIVVKIEEDDNFKENRKSDYIGVSFYRTDSKWYARRWSKNEKKMVFNGNYKHEEIAAHASDTLARKLTENGEKDHKFNFPDDDTEVYGEEKSSKYLGVSYNKKRGTWLAQRRNKNEMKMGYNGTYKDEETAAHASDTLARKLNANGERGHKLNFPDNDTEVYPEKSSNFIGVSYNAKDLAWYARRWSKNEKKTFCNGAAYKDEETAAHASDALARKLIANGEKGHKLNFPNDDTKVFAEHYQEKKRKRPNNARNSRVKKYYQI